MPTLTHTNRAAYTIGKLNNKTVKMLLDSGASCSVVLADYACQSEIKPMPSTKLVNADGRNISPLGSITMSVTLGDFSVKQSFIVVEHLSTPVILGCDYLTDNGFVLHFKQGVFHRADNPDQKLQLLPAEAAIPCYLVSIDDDCPQAIPTKCQDYGSARIDMPSDIHPSLAPVLDEFKALFSQQLGKTNVTEHIIDTGDVLPIKIPPRQIPFHYADKVHTQLEDMAKECIIFPSTSPWCAPAVYVPKSSGEIRICVDFVQLNKVTKKDSYPVPRSEGPQQKLAGKRIFSKLDLKSAYWQFPMEAQSIEKTAFCPGPGYGLWEFTRMPYGLTCATQTCQRGLDTILQNCKHCVDNYVDDCIVFSDDMTSHIRDLRLVLEKLKAAGLTLRGSKCSFGLDKITHLGFEYSSAGVAPSSADQDGDTQENNRDSGRGPHVVTRSGRVVRPPDYYGH